MKFRLARAADLEPIAAIYEEIHDAEEAGRARIGWVRGVYPTRETARAAIAAGVMYVAEEDGNIVASAKIDREQVPEYALAHWSADVPAEQVLVLHTLCVSPRAAGRGIGSAFVGFYEHRARPLGCTQLRMDTNERNAAARELYQKLGYREVGIVPCTFNGIPGVRLVCLEKIL